MTQEAPRPSDFRVLLVDDDEKLLSALHRVLRQRFVVTTANGPAEALQLLRDKGPFDCAVSDLDMPGMGGLVLMGHVRKYFPDVIRIMLTGTAEVPHVVHALNDELIFRFLLKPCRSDDVVRAVEAAERYQQLVHSERELLQGTWQGSVTALLEVLALVHPSAFGRADRLSRMVEHWLRKLSTDDPWEAVMACKLTQLGAAGLAPSILSRIDTFELLNDVERAEVARMPAIAEQLLRHIPRLEIIRALLLEINLPPSELSVPAAAIRLALSLDPFLSRGAVASDAIQEIRQHVFGYPEALLAIASTESDLFANNDVELYLSEVQVGMIFATDVLSPKQLLLAARGQVVTPSIRERIGVEWKEFACDTRIRVQKTPAASSVATS